MKVLQLKNVPLYYGPRVNSVMTDKSNTTKEPTTNSNSGYRSTISGKDASSLKLELPYDDGNILFTHSLIHSLTYSLTHSLTDSLTYLLTHSHTHSSPENSDVESSRDYGKPFRKTTLPSLR